jgi:chromate transporter
MHRTWGGLVAGTLFVLPSFFILVGLAYIYMAYGEVPAIAGMLYGIKPAVVAIVLFAAYRIGLRALKNKVLWSIAAFAFLAIFILKLPFPLIVFVAASIGYLGSQFYPNYFRAGGHSNKNKHYGKSLIDDDTPTPSHAIFSWIKLIRVALIGIAIWLISMAALISEFGWDSAFTQMGWFFTKAALLTFGGAYAVLPYVYQGAVEHYQWLSATQMMDALALGETTPGPLVMVNTFVGFVGGWLGTGTSDFGAFACALIAASIVTFFTFLPSFVFILMGGPFIETSHGNLKLTAPLTAITAAVVGVILNLALFFAYHVFYPTGFNGSLDLFAISLSIAALVGLFRFRLSVIPVIIISGIIGMCLQLFI